MFRTKKCEFCGREFQYEISRGRDKKYCSEKCSRGASKQRRLQQYESLPACSTPWCENKANRKGVGLCEACYMRIRRKGTTDYKELPHRLNQSAGYVWLREPDHPLATSGGLVYEHRFVFYNAKGKGPFKCHWCGATIGWDNMHIDHLDDDKKNNAIDNLVSSCPACNQERGRWKMIAKQRDASRKITYNGTIKTISSWANDLGLSRPAFLWRMERWPIEKVMTTPHGKSGPISGRRV